MVGHWPGMSDGPSEETDRASELRARVDLARVPAFSLAGLSVEPAERRITAPDGTSETLEPRVMQVLVALWRAAGAVMSREDLVAACWGGTHVGDDAVSRFVVRARRLGEGIGGGRFTIETLPRVGYRLIVADSDGSPEAADPPAARCGEEKPSVGRRPWLLALLAGPIIALGLWWWLVPAGPRAASVNLTPFEVGGGLPRSAAAALDSEVRAAFDDADLTVRARDADYVLIGAAHPRGDAIRYIATLKEARSDGAIATIVRELPSDSLSTRFAQTLAATMGCVVDGIAQHHQQLALETTRIWAQFCEARTIGDGVTGRMLDLARRLRADAPEFTGGWYATAYTVGLMGMSEPQRVTPALQAEALSAAKRFAELAPDRPRAWEILAGASSPKQPLRREALLRRAIATAPEACGCAFQALGDFLVQSGRIEEAGQMYRRGVDQDRAGAIALFRPAMHAYAAGRVAEGDAAMRQLERLRPGSGAAARTAFDRARWAGRWREAAEAVPLADPAARAAVREGMLALDSGDKSRIARAGSAIERAAVSTGDELVFAPVLALLGRSEAALAVIERSRAGGHNYSAPGRHPGFARPLLFDPSLRPLFDHPRFGDFLERAGFIAYWKGSRSRPDMCAARNAPAFCRLI